MKGFNLVEILEFSRVSVYHLSDLYKKMADESRKKRAAALKYDPDTDSAPRVIASGKGVIAEAIIRKAREHGIPIRENPPLAELLTAVPLGAEIPPDLYEAVAEILARILKLDSSK